MLIGVAGFEPATPDVANVVLPTVNGSRPNLFPIP
jgi:hypothetical protein